MSREYPCVYYDHEKCTLHGSDSEHIDWCVLGPCSKETPSNADHIRSMSDEELAEWIYNGVSSDPCDYCDPNSCFCDGATCGDKADTEIIADWLKQPYKEDVSG